MMNLHIGKTFIDSYHRTWVLLGRLDEDWRCQLATGANQGFECTFTSNYIQEMMCLGQNAIHPALA